MCSLSIVNSVKWLMPHVNVGEYGSPNAAGGSSQRPPGLVMGEAEFAAEL
jgi:hypothetical protein